jgi:hypothetical protein
MEDAIKSEKAVNDALAAAWNAFVALERQHPDEADEFRRGIHALQGIMALRACRRLMSDTYPTYVAGVDFGAGDSKGVGVKARYFTPGVTEPSGPDHDKMLAEGWLWSPGCGYWRPAEAVGREEVHRDLVAALARDTRPLGDCFPRARGTKCCESYEDVLGGGR